ncbi:MAG: DUF4345 domain-containing protein [Chitinophagaceae bacterium]
MSVKFGRSRLPPTAILIWKSAGAYVSDLKLPPNLNSIIIKVYHLVISVIILLPIAITYGIAPDLTLPGFFDFRIETTDLKNVFRAIMGLYMSMIALWILGILKRKYWFMATVANVLFMSGLGLGRLISLALDGTPSPKFFIGMLLEFLLAAWGIYNLKHYKNLKGE